MLLLLFSVVLLAEDSLISSELADKELITETIHSVEKNGDYKVFPARCLGDVYSQLGRLANDISQPVLIVYRFVHVCNYDRVYLYLYCTYVITCQHML